MTPWRPSVVPRWPVLVASRTRAFFNYRRLDSKLRLRILARRHARGYYFSPRDGDEDVEAVEWIAGQVARYGGLRWSRSRWTKFTKLDKQET
jgi:hypothetical protein